MKKRYRLKNWVVYTFIFICLGILIYSALNILIWKKGVDKNEKAKKKTNDLVKVVDDEYIIDFDALKKENKDVVAYIKVYGTNIEYVVVKTKDNDYYLDHNFNKKYSKIGWIYADYRNLLDGSDKNLIIYGHNTRDGSMFGSLKNVLKEKWYSDKSNNKITLVTEDNTYNYKVFSAYVIEPEDYYLTTSFLSDYTYNEFINKIKNRTEYNYGVSVDTKDRILTLSTCVSGGKKRVVVHAKMISKTN